MQITKNDLYSFIRKVAPNENNDQQKNNISAVKSGEESSASTYTKFNIDHLRQKVLSLQSDVNELQTNLTKNQTIQQGIENLQGAADWVNVLEEHIRQSFKQPDFVLAEKNPAKMLEILQSQNEGLVDNIKRKEVQLENIFSSGMVNDQKSLSATHFEGVFNKIPGEKIADLLKND